MDQALTSCALHRGDDVRGASAVSCLEPGAIRCVYHACYVEYHIRSRYQRIERSCVIKCARDPCDTIPLRLRSPRQRPHRKASLKQLIQCLRTHKPGRACNSDCSAHSITR